MSLFNDKSGNNSRQSANSTSWLGETAVGTSGCDIENNGFDKIAGGADGSTADSSLVIGWCQRLIFYLLQSLAEYSPYAKLDLVSYAICKATEFKQKPWNTE